MITHFVTGWLLTAKGAEKEDQEKNESVAEEE